MSTCFGVNWLKNIRYSQIIVLRDDTIRPLFGAVIISMLPLIRGLFWLAGCLRPCPGWINVCSLSLISPLSSLPHVFWKRKKNTASLQTCVHSLAVVGGEAGILCFQHLVFFACSFCFFDFFPFILLFLFYIVSLLWLWSWWLLLLVC